MTEIRKCVPVPHIRAPRPSYRLSRFTAIIYLCLCRAVFSQDLPPEYYDVPNIHPPPEQSYSDDLGTAVVYFFTDRVVAKLPPDDGLPPIRRADAEFTSEIDKGEGLLAGRAYLTYPNHRTRGDQDFALTSDTDNPATDFSLRGFDFIDGAEVPRVLAEAVAQSRGSPLLFVHGYRNNFYYAAAKAAQLSFDLNTESVSFLFSWPSDFNLTPGGYNAAVANSMDSAEPFASLIRFFFHTLNKRPTVVAHSLGAELVSRSMSKLRKEDMLAYNALIFAAPDIDEGDFLKDDAMKSSSDFLTIYCSDDRALLASSMMNFLRPRVGNCPGAARASYGGMALVAVRGAKETFLNHDYFSQRIDVLDDIEKAISASHHQPSTAYDQFGFTREVPQQ